MQNRRRRQPEEGGRLQLRRGDRLGHGRDTSTWSPTTAPPIHGSLIK